MSLAPHLCPEASLKTPVTTNGKKDDKIALGNTYRYAFTVKDNRTGSEDYEPMIKRLEHFGTVESLSRETVTKSGKPTKLHLHGTLACNDKLHYKSVGLPGYHTRFAVIYSAHWEEYSKKQEKHIDFSRNVFS